MSGEPVEDLLAAIDAALEARFGVTEDAEELEFDLSPFDREPIFEDGEIIRHLLFVLPMSGERSGFVETRAVIAETGRPLVVARAGAPTLLGFRSFVAHLDDPDRPSDVPVLDYVLGGATRLRRVRFETVASVLARDPGAGYFESLLRDEMQAGWTARAEALSAMQAPPFLRLIDLLAATLPVSEVLTIDPTLLPGTELREFLGQYLDAGDVSRLLGVLVRSGIIAAERARLPKRVRHLIDVQGKRRVDDRHVAVGFSLSERSRVADGDTSMRDAFRIVAPDRLSSIAKLVRDRSPACLRDLRAAIRSDLRRGALVSARNKSLDSIDVFPWDLELRYLSALALARLGATDDAEAQIVAALGGPVDPQDIGRFGQLEKALTRHPDPMEIDGVFSGCVPPVGFAWTDSSARDLVRDVYALFGRLNKDRLIRELAAGRDGKSAAKAALDAYASTARWLADDHYVAINAAAMAVFVGADEAPRQLADGALRKAGGDDYWSLATQAEALGLLERFDEAEEMVRRAEDRAREDRRSDADLNAMRRQYALLAGPKPGFKRLLEALSDQPVAVLTGHMMPLSLGPAEREKHAEKLKASLAKSIASAKPAHLFCALARGADILSVRAFRAMNPDLDVHVVLPFEIDVFDRKSVTGDSTAATARSWFAAFKEELTVAASLHVVWPNGIAERDTWSGIVVANRVMTGLALLKADEVAAQSRHFLGVVADAYPTSHEGAVALMNDWEKHGLSPERVDCSWRAPAHVPPLEPRPVPWSVVAMIIGAEEFGEVDRALSSHGVDPSDIRYVEHKKNRQMLQLPLDNASISGLAAIAETTGARILADYVYAPNGKARMNALFEPGEAEALPAACLIVPPNLAALIRYCHNDVAELLFSGLLRRSRKSRSPDRPIAASAPLYRVLRRTKRN